MCALSSQSLANDSTANDAEDEIARHACRLVINRGQQHMQIKPQM